MTLCLGDPATFTFIGTPNATVTYNINGGANQSIVINGLGTATLTGSYTANTTLTILSVTSAGTPSCVNLQTSSVTLTVQPLPTASVAVSPTLLCSGDSATFTFTGTPNATIIYNINGGANQPVVINGLGTATLTGSYTANTTVTILSVTSAGAPSCVNLQTSSAMVTVVAPPIPGVNASTAICVLSPSFDLFPLLGPTAQTGGTWSPALASGTGIFNPAVDAGGTYTYTLSATAPCQPLSAAVQVIVKPIPDAGNNATLSICPNQNSVDLFASLTGAPQSGGTWSPALASGTGVFNPAVDVSGVYTYTVTGISPCVDDTSTVTVTVNPLPNAGTFTGIVSLCTSVGVLDLTTLLTGQNSGGTWTDSSAQTVASSVAIINLAAGTYSYTYAVTNSCGTATEAVQFVILPNPQLATVNVTVSPACLGSNVILNLNGMVDGVYTLSYNLAGVNILSGQTATVTITSGVGNFSIPSASLPNVGTTVITFTNILNTVSNCSSTLTGVMAQIVVRPLADIVSPNLAAANICFGTDVVVNITNAINLPDGAYQFNYSIPGATPTSGVTGNIMVTGGVGQFTVPASVFTVAGNYTLTVVGIITTTGCVNANENATVSFVINPIPSITTATVTVQDTCANYVSLVTISGATNMPDGNYTIGYQLSGANTASTMVTVTCTGGIITFTIPATDLINSGSTTLTIGQLNSVATTCGTTGNVVNPITFNVAQLGTPQLIHNGNLFCGDNNPTVDSLTANLVGFPTVIWYDAPTGGTAYASTDLLVNETTYYAALVAASGCEGSVRLAVTVNLTVCGDILIPDGFSPNNDGINDTFEINNLEVLYPNFKMEIYNRYGNLIYTGNRNTQNWDGTTTIGGLNLCNNVLPTGVYFYILNFNDGARKAVQGRLYLNR